MERRKKNSGAINKPDRKVCAQTSTFLLSKTGRETSFGYAKWVIVQRLFSRYCSGRLRLRILLFVGAGSAQKVAGKKVFCIFIYLTDLKNKV